MSSAPHVGQCAGMSFAGAPVCFCGGAAPAENEISRCSICIVTLRVFLTSLFASLAANEPCGKGSSLVTCCPIPVGSCFPGKYSSVVPAVMTGRAADVFKVCFNRSQFFSTVAKALPLSTFFRFGEFEIDLAARSLTREGQTVALNPRTFDLLAYFATHSQTLVTRDELLGAIWPDSFVEESNLSQHVFLLRKALSDSSSTTRLVVTIPGRGYIFAAAVEDAPRALTTSAPSFILHASESIARVVVEEESQDEAPALGSGAHGKHRQFLGLAAALVIAFAAGVFLTWRHMRASPARRVDILNIGIENTTGDPDLDYGLNAALRIDLEQSPFLNVLSPSQIQETLVEMQRSPNEVLTPALAREICERNNDEAMLHGTLSPLGGHYLLIVGAESCVSGRQLAESKAQVSSKDDLLPALDTAADRVRRQLGESAASLDHYRVPVAEATTSSLDALRAYSEAGESFRRGDMKASQNLLDRAVALDPNFASAYRILGSTWYNLGDYAQASALYKRAFDLREQTTERERMGIEVMYYGYSLYDYEESIRRTRQFLELYPDVANSWVSLANLYTLLGEYPQAVDAARHAIQLDPRSGVGAAELVRAYARDNRFSDAKAAGAKAVADGKDHWDIHTALFEIAVAEGDQARIQSEGQWGLTHQHADTSLSDLGLAAAAAGKLRGAEDYFSRAIAEAARNGDEDFTNSIIVRCARAQVLLGQPAAAVATLKNLRAGEDDPGNPGESAYILAMSGEPAAAQRFLAASDPKSERNTVRAYVSIPMMRAILALQAHHPAEAVRALEPARPYELRDFSVPWLRAEAETEAGMLPAAEQDYRLILRNPGVESIAPEYSLAHLRLAQVLVRESGSDAARREYQAFLEAWKDADSDIELVRQAKAEYASLLSASPGKRPS
jgi:DNA-binding winged helix-turn-helix (wHTH) protein/tetratricopeptide (TPR) repeat protein